MIGNKIIDPFDEDYTFMEYCKEADRITASYYVSRGDGTGYYQCHDFPLDYVDKLLKEGKLEDKDDMADFLYGDACSCPTICIDSGSDDFDAMVIDCMNQRDVIAVRGNADYGFVLGVWRATR